MKKKFKEKRPGSGIPSFSLDISIHRATVQHDFWFLPYQ